MSTLRCNAIQNTSGVEQYLAKAWVNFNGTGTVAIRASGNVSSITDNGVGTYTVNLITAMPDTNYSFVGSIKSGTNSGGVFYSREADSLTTSAFTVRTRDGTTSTLNDLVQVMIAVFR